MDRAGLVIEFDGMVQTTTSEPQLTAKTLLIRTGGAIGIGKNLVWLIIFVLTSLGTIKKFLKQSFQF